MTSERRWEERYRTGDLPWDTGRPDRNMEQLFLKFDIAPCKILEIGCGTGTNAVWLDGKGFSVMAIDVSPLAIEKAKRKAEEAGASVHFSVADILSDPVPGGPYKLVFDRGCLHSFDTREDRATCVDVVHTLLDEGGRWVSMIGSKDGPPREVGPPRWSVQEIAAAVESRFEILYVAASHFDSDQPVPARSWVCVLRKRTEY